ncbi:hypothetical protein GCK72_025396 [Caenorhabditis remanei]|uniref:Uncharacterized protein n=1 Tax=Caenorhabditis remanei TaxID=31234 RepID=A0A6A5G2Z5_CAERE|nr:hypothetical protein GCK72_025396 [Caenorhabditis remanei]KAF1748929.1 hypothetical protein GCK72_025396 [Caenorhabditis remanei]
MRISMLCLFLAVFQVVGATCPCDGITLDGSDQEHCWLVLPREGRSWSAGDDSCVAVGGHLGHPMDDNYGTIVSYAQKESSLPVLTGIVASNDGVSIAGALCQNNGFWEVISNTTRIFTNQSNLTATCTYIKPSTNGIVFDECGIESNVLCDRPLEKQDYCSIMANCSSTTTLLSTTTAMSSTTSNLSSTSPTTQLSSSSSTAGGIASLSTTKVGQLTSTVTDAGSGNGNGGSVTTSASTSTTCKCTGSDVTTTTTTAAPAGSCPQQTGCLKHQWKIFGMCVDWRAMLALLAIGLLLFLCCCICHCCMHACMFCTPARKEKVNRNTVVAPVPVLLPQKVDYDVEKSETVVLPPPAIQPEPVYITVPEKHESVYGFHTKEIIHVMPERPHTKDVATMTDILDNELPTFMPVPTTAPLMKRKKAVKKPKKMFIPATADPMNSIEEDIAAEIPIDIPDSPGARSVAPLGDVVDPVPIVPLNFARNPKPMMPEPKSHDDIPLPGQSSIALPPQQQKPNMSSDNGEFDPSGLRSPPIPANAKPNDAAPKRMTFSPIADESEEETGARIPSPPREPKASGGRSGNNGNNNGSGLSPNSAPENRPTLKNQRLNEMPSPTPAGNPPAPAKSPSSSNGGSSNPFANLGGASPAQEDNGGRAPGDDVGMRAARGRLGGAVRGGGGGGEAPSGWKPWAKGGARR